MPEYDAVGRDFGYNRSFRHLRALLETGHVDENESILWVFTVHMDVHVEILQFDFALGAKLVNRGQGRGRR